MNKLPDAAQFLAMQAKPQKTLAALYKLVFTAIPNLHSACSILPLLYLTLEGGVIQVMIFHLDG